MLSLLPLLRISHALLHAQTPAPAPPLQFIGFEVGQSLTGVAERSRALGGRLACKRSRTDSTLHECQAVMHDSSGRELRLWLSAVDSATSVMTLATRMTVTGLLRWQGELAEQFGSARERSRGRQHSLQWIRANTMMRLTWRPEAGGLMASVSLVDGGRLDAWGRRIEQRMQPVEPVAADSVPPHP
ncbi:MAG: hypothetical protein ABJC74_17640 [Gemmatimonadota bacterium]